MKKIIPTLFITLFCLVPTAPVAIGYTNPFPKDTQNQILLVTTFLVVAPIILILRIAGVWKWSTIGFRPKKFFDGFHFYLCAWIAAGLLAAPYAHLLGFTYPIDLSHVDKIEMTKYSFLFCWMQDVLYLSFLLTVGEAIFKKDESLSALCVVVLFIWMHSLFERQWEVMAFVTPGACIFVGLYYKYRNIYLSTTTHVIFSLVAFRLGVFHY